MQITLADNSEAFMVAIPFHGEDRFTVNEKVVKSVVSESKGIITPADLEILMPESRSGAYEVALIAFREFLLAKNISFTLTDRDAMIIEATHVPTGSKSSRVIRIVRVEKSILEKINNVRNSKAVPVTYKEKIRRALRAGRS